MKKNKMLYRIVAAVLACAVVALARHVSEPQ